MGTTNTFSVLFWVKNEKGETGRGIIYARITVNQKRVLVSLKRKILLKLWDSGRKRAKGHSVDARQLNQYLDSVQSRFFHCYQELTSKGKKVTAKLIKAVYLGDGENSKTLQELIQYHSRKIESTLASGTIRNFGITEGYINKFLAKEKNTTDVYLRELDYKFLCDFQNFLLEYYPKKHPREMSHNTVMKHIQRLRKIIRLAYHLEWIDKDPFMRWKTTFEKKEREFLSPNELSNLETYEFPIERLDRVRDLFVFSCYTGISYVDIMGLSLDNISLGIDGNNWIMTKRQKTKTSIKIPLLDPALHLIKKYSDHPMTIITGTLLPVITNEKLNVYLKEVALLCGLKKNLTFHMARHTFATTVTLSNGVPIETVSKLLGHTKIATTQIYARVLEKKVSEDMNDLREILKKNKGIT
ncbi:site-specific integrase [Antarcticibacterium arcticum]|uniref:Site-specific integrase n=1 Tax=Antarcticibacterium arcticum TaxID=2585771 RepID=A0A5B8YR27_9FLAO|nr:site-specific integrase [Antarcticibacterium arcticum]QED38946.1 site-specific integrase [Antarcticibacterium arcticum]